jgi:hypothetical protein
MMPFIKLLDYLWGSTSGENTVGSERREREEQINTSERRSVSQKWKWRGLEMAICGKGHLSIISNTNQ